MPPPPPGPGLYPCPAPCPTAGERACAADCCIDGMPEFLWPVYAPAGMYRIPWTGEFNPRGDNWTFFGGQSLTYDSNIFLSEDDEEDDFISHTSVGASYRREGGAYHVAASVVGTYDWYFDHEDLDFFNVFGILDAGWRGANAYLRVADRLNYGQDPIVVRDDTFLVISEDLNDYWTNELDVRAGYECVCWRAEVGYDLDVFLSCDDVLESFEHWDHGFHGRFDWYLSPKLSLGARAGVRFIDYDDDTQEDFTVYDVGGTFSWRPTAKFGILGSVGVGRAEDGDEEDSWVADITASLAATTKLTIEATYRRSFEPSLGADAQIIDLLMVRADTAFQPNWSVDASAGVQLGDTLSPTNDGAQDYTIFFFNAAVHHTFNCWLSGDLSYLYRTQDADNLGLDYDVHRITAGLTVTL
jgi:hypothetical protein